MSAPITHIVCFKYKADISADQLREVAARFESLKASSKRDGRPVVTGFRGGSNNSPETAVTKGMQHVFVVDFANADDRAYYLDECPAHNEFKKWVGPLLDDLVVADFTPGVW